MKNISLKEFVSMSVDKAKTTLDNLHKIPDSKAYTKDETRNIASHLVSLKYTMEKCCNGKLIPTEMKPMASNFEKAGGDISKMLPLYSQSLKKTYQDLSYAVNADTSLNKDSSAKLYCDLYETMTGAKFKNLLNKVRTSKVAKDSTLSSEGLSFLDTLDISIYEKVRGIESYTQSEENVILDNLRTVASGLTGTATNLSGVTRSVNILSIIIMVVMILVFLMLVTLATIFSIYNSRMNHAIVLLTERQTGNDILGSTERDRITKAAKEIDDYIPPMTKASLFKSARIGEQYINNLASKGFAKFSKAVDLINNSSSKEDFDPERSEEGFTLLIGAISLAGLFLVIPAFRAGVYYAHHLHLNFTQFFEEQKEILDVNIDQLITKANDINTPANEKKRLEKIIEKQQKWISHLESWSGTSLNEEQIKAASDFNDEMKDDERHDFDHDIYLLEQERANGNDLEMGTPKTKPGSIII